MINMPYLFLDHPNYGKPWIVSQEYWKYKIGFICFSKWIFSGVGYHIVMVKEAHCNVEEIFKLLQYYIPTATLEKNVSNEVSFILPKEYTHRYESREYKMIDV